MREVAWVIFDEIHYMRDAGLCGIQMAIDIYKMTFSAD